MSELYNSTDPVTEPTAPVDIDDGPMGRITGSDPALAELNRERYGAGVTENSPEAQELIDQRARGEEYNKGKIDPFDTGAVEYQNEVVKSFEDIRDDYLAKLDSKIDEGILPASMKDKWHTIVDTRVAVRTNLDPNQGAINQTHITLDKEKHNILVPPEILSQQDHKWTFEHELSHMLEGNNLGTNDEEGASGLNRLFPEKSFLGTALNEGMTDLVTELISGDKPNYGLRENEGTQNYHIFHDFIDFLCNKGQKPVDFDYFIKAYTTSGESGRLAIDELRAKIAEAFPSDNGVHVLDNLAAHNDKQIRYWMAVYTGHKDTAEALKKQLG